MPAAGGELVWVFSDETVRAVDPLYAVYGAPLGEWMPDAMFTRLWVLELWQWLGLLVLALLSWPLSFVIERIALSALTRAAHLTKFRWDEQLVAAGRGPVRLLVFAGGWPGASRALILPEPAQVLVDVLARTLFIAALAWFALRFVRLISEVLQETVKKEAPEDVGRARGLQTQVTVLRRVFSVAIVVIAAALALMQFKRGAQRASAAA